MPENKGNEYDKLFLTVYCRAIVALHKVDMKKHFSL